MSALDLAQLSACLARLQRRGLRPGLTDLPLPLLTRVLAYCDPVARQAAARTCRKLARAARDLEQDLGTTNMADCNDNLLTLDCLPADVLLTVFKFLTRQELGRMAQVCTIFRDLSYSEFLWVERSRLALGSNQLDQVSLSRSQQILSARDRVRLGKAWETGDTLETLIAVQGAKFMPRLQLEARRLWVSWGTRIWCHPRLPGGGVAKTTTKMLRGHSDDVSKFVVAEGIVVSGGRDRSLCAWSANSGNFLFARRYCHGGEISAVDVTSRGRVLVTGSRDKTVLVWNVRQDPDRDALLPIPTLQLQAEDRVWSLAVSPEDGRSLVVGTAGTRGVAPLRLYDLVGGHHIMDLGRGLKNGSGMLDLSWLSPTTLLACGYDTFTRLWDTRCGGAVRAWEEPFDEAVYCLATDKVNLLVTGTSRHGRVRVWDMRHQSPLYMRHAAPARRGQSSPVYSLAVDASNMYAALDQSLNHFGFSGVDPKTVGRRTRRY